MDIDSWVKHCEHLRDKVIRFNPQTRRNEYLLVNFSDTLQKQDITQRTELLADNYARVKINVKAWSEKEMAKRGKKVIDFSDNSQVLKSLANDFDMPYWAFVKNPAAPFKEFNDIFVWQLKVCNLFCPPCYVDEKSRDGKLEGGNFFSTAEMIDAFERERKKQPLHMLRPSGGEVSLVPEHWLEILQEMDKRGIQAYVQGDTNLTTGTYIQCIESRNSDLWNLLGRIGEFKNFGLLCSFKGTDTASFLRATGLSEGYEFLEEERWKTFDMYVKAGIDAYPFVYNPDPDTLEAFMEQGARRYGEGFFLKTWVFPMNAQYEPPKARIKAKGQDPAAFQAKLDEAYERSNEVMQNLISRKFGINYKAIPRTGIELKVKN